MDSTKLSKLRSILGAGTLINNGTQILFKCPFCPHHKKKLSVHLELEQYHCWICNAKGRSLSSLMIKLKQPSDIVNFFRKNTNNILLRTGQVAGSDKELISLPDHYKPLYIKDTNPDYLHAIRYVKQRGLSVGDILKYQIGYCNKGPYSGMIIVPSYDAEYQLNFFTGRSFYPEARMKHKNPKISKDIIGFESFINWNMPIILVEGAFDAITIKRNTIPLFGKMILPKLKEKILLNKVSEVYVCLDTDARRQALKVADYFTNNGIQTHFVKLDDRDPNELGFHKMQNILEKTDKFDFSDMIKMKLSL